MIKGVSMKMIPLLLLAGFSSMAGASGFQLLEQNASGLGNAYAGSAAAAENASTVYYNPAGMTELQGFQASGGLAVVGPTYKFSNSGSRNPTAFGGGTATGGNGDDAGTVGTIPNGYLSWGVTKDLYLGLGVGAPFGLKTDYASDWVGRFQAISFDIKTVNVNPSVAYRVNDTVSLGFGVNYQQINAEYIRQATPAAQVKLSLDDSAWGWNAGALFKVSPSTKVGVSYRSAIRYSMSGNFRGAANANAKAELKVPDTFIMSVTQKLSDRWEMLGDVSRTGWSVIPKVDILYAANGSLAQTLDTDYRNTWRVALGANYQYNESLKLKYGVAYDQTPVKAAETRLASLPDTNRVWISGGAQYRFSRAAVLDVGAAYLYLRGPSINNLQQPTRGLVSGNYSGSIWIVGAQYSHAF